MGITRTASTKQEAEHMKTVSWGQNRTAVCIGDSQRDIGVANMLVAKISAYQ